MLEIFLLVLAVSIDSFMTSFSYGISKIKIPVKSALLISAVGSGLLGISMLFADFIASFIPVFSGKLISASLLFLIGGMSFFSELIKNILRKNEGIKELRFKYSGIGFVLSLYLEETSADIDNSNSISAKEALFLALALSADNLVTGFSAGLFKADILVTVGVTFLMGFCAVFFGSKYGGKYSRSFKSDMSFLSGAVLMLLAVIRFFT